MENQAKKNIIPTSSNNGWSRKQEIQSRDEFDKPLSDNSPIIAVIVLHNDTEKETKDLEGTIRSIRLQGYFLEVIWILAFNKSGNLEILIDKLDDRFCIETIKDNLNPGKIINEYLRDCKVSLVAIINSGDILLPKAWKNLLDFRKQEPDAVLWCADVNLVSKFCNYSRIGKPILGSPKAWGRWNKKYGPYLYLSACLFSLEAFLLAGGANEDLQNTWDIDLIMRLNSTGHFKYFEQTIVDLIDNPIKNTHQIAHRTCELIYLNISHNRLNYAIGNLSSYVQARLEATATSYTKDELTKMVVSERLSKIQGWKYTLLTLMKILIGKFELKLLQKPIRSYRDLSQNRNMINKKRSKGTLGAGYIVFDGIELLEYSISQLRNTVDFIDVSYQELSWFGEPIKESYLEILYQLKNSGMIDSLNKYESEYILDRYDGQEWTSLRAKAQEKRKRQLGLERCLSAKCTHFLGLDVDEFYLSNELAYSWERIISENIDYSACVILEYLNLPTIQNILPQGFIPLINRIAKGTRIGIGPSFIQCDPTRGFDTQNGKVLIFEPNEIIMHHMITVRQDIYAKYCSSTLGDTDLSNIDTLINDYTNIKKKDCTMEINRYNGKILCTVNNVFNIPLELFNI